MTEINYINDIVQRISNNTDSVFLSLKQIELHQEYCTCINQIIIHIVQLWNLLSQDTVEAKREKWFKTGLGKFMGYFTFCGGY